jgi:hypothetical protein
MLNLLIYTPMDNTTTYASQQIFRSVSATKRVALLFMLLCSYVITANAQVNQNTNRPDVSYGLSMGASGAGFGTLYMESISLTKYRSTFTVSACLQKRTMQFKGFQFGYSYELANNGSTFFSQSPNGSQQLSAFAYARYIHGAPLGKAMAKAENMQNPTQDVDWNNVYLSTAEAAVGMEFNIKIARRLVWNNYLGFTTFHRTTYDVPMYFGRTNVSISLGTGITLVGI